MKVTINMAGIVSSKNDFELEMSRPKPTLSRKRQNNPEKQLNEFFEDICDKSIVFDTTKMFIQPVKKKEVPDYHLRILNPMDLGTMKNKTKRWGKKINGIYILEYNTIEAFKKDLEQIRINAETYNGIQHFLANQARTIVSFALDIIEK